ncbi:hypothetical protein McanMca71_003184 [Microsporum canis]
MELSLRASPFDVDDIRHVEDLERELRGARRYIKDLERELKGARNLIDSLCLPSPPTGFAALGELVDAAPIVGFPSLQAATRTPGFGAEAARHLTDSQALPTSNSSGKNPSGKEKGFTFVLCDPLTETSLAAPREGLNKAQVSFLSSIPQTKDWKVLEAITEAQIYRLLLRQDVRFNDEGDSSSRTNTKAAPDLHSWDKGCYHYAVNTSGSIRKHSADGNALNFRVIIVILMCTVMLKTGVSVDSVDNIMKTCVGDYAKKTLRTYRKAAKWVNRVALKCIEKGWGARSAELLYRSGIERKGSPPPPLDDEQMPISIPCVIKYLAGENISLEVICRALSDGALSYDYEDTRRIYGLFYTPRSEEITYRNPPPSQGGTTARSSIIDSPGSAAEAQSLSPLPPDGSEDDSSDYEPHPEDDSIGSGETTASTPPFAANRETDSYQPLEVLAEAAARSKETNKRPHPADNGSQCRDSQRRRLNGRGKGNDPIPTPWTYNTTLPNTGQPSMGTPFELDPNFAIDPTSLHKSAPYQPPKRTIIQTNTNTDVQTDDPFFGVDANVPDFDNIPCNYNSDYIPFCEFDNDKQWGFDPDEAPFCDFGVDY